MRNARALGQIHRQIDERFPEHLERCRAFLRQPSVSATGEGILETAAMVRAFIEELGGTVSYGGAPSHPIVHGRLGGSGGPTLIVYGMYDVQPVERQKWSHPPFGAELWQHPRHGQCVVSRGAVNSKGALAGLFNALRAAVEVDRLPLDLIFVIEGEEEIGSPHFEGFIREHADQLQGIGVADFDFSEDPKKNVTLHLGLKGIVYLELKARGGKRGGPTEQQHSSAGAWISSPVWRLVHALSTLVDNRERITIDGFYDNVAPISRRDNRLLRKLAATFDEEAFLREIKALCFKYRISGVELLRKGLYTPIINIDGVQAGHTGKGNRTVLPRVATANIDIRFGPNLEPEEVIAKFRGHLDRLGFDDIELTVKEGYTWSKTEFDEPLVQHLIAAYRQHGRDPQVWPMATWTAPYFVFSRILRLPVVAGGLGYGNRPHSPNEYMTVEGLRDFEKWVVTFLYRLAGGAGAPSQRL
jgi:acetylornithine deacetylase/succinyl-diaminopimelate desuccinylase-like protein